MEMRGFFFIDTTVFFCSDETHNQFFEPTEGWDVPWRIV